MRKSLLVALLMAAFVLPGVCVEQWLFFPGANDFMGLFWGLDVLVPASGAFAYEGTAYQVDKDGTDVMSFNFIFGPGFRYRPGHSALTLYGGIGIGYMLPYSYIEHVSDSSYYVRSEYVDFILDAGVRAGLKVNLSDRFHVYTEAGAAYGFRKLLDASVRVGVGCNFHRRG